MDKLPLIIGATIIGGILFLFSGDEEGDASSDEILENQENIRKLRQQLRHQQKKKKELLRKVGPKEGETNS